MFTARMVSWVVGSQQTREAIPRSGGATTKESDVVTVLRAEVEALRAELRSMDRTRDGTVRTGTIDNSSSTRSWV